MTFPPYEIDSLPVLDPIEKTRKTSLCRPYVCATIDPNLYGLKSAVAETSRDNSKGTHGAVLTRIYSHVALSMFKTLTSVPH